jgi:hypothetical protein
MTRPWLGTQEDQLQAITGDREGLFRGVFSEDYPCRRKRGKVSSSW